MKTASYFLKLLIFSLKGPEGNLNLFPANETALKQTIFKSYFMLLSCNPSSKIAKLNFSLIALIKDNFLLLLKKTLLFLSNNLFSSRWF